MAFVLRTARKTQCCTGNEALVAKVAKKWGFAAIFAPIWTRKFRESRQPTYVDWAMAGDRRKWLTGMRLRAWPGAIGRTEVQVALRLISAARRVN